MWNPHHRPASKLAAAVCIAWMACGNADAQQAKLLKYFRTTSFGGGGGSEFENACPIPSVMTGIQARQGSWIDALAPICSTYDRARRTFVQTGNPPLVGGKGGGPAAINCLRPRGVVVNLELMQANNHDGSVGLIAVTCGDYHDPGRFVGKVPGGATILGQSQRGSTGARIVCPPPYIAGGLHGRAGAFIDRIGLTCVNYQPRQ